MYNVIQLFQLIIDFYEITNGKEENENIEFRLFSISGIL